jgi:hypothetical protein
LPTGARLCPGSRVTSTGDPAGMEAQGFFRSIGQGARGGRANASLGFRVELRRDDLLVFSIETP